MGAAALLAADGSSQPPATPGDSLGSAALTGENAASAEGIALTAGAGQLKSWAACCRRDEAG